MTTPTYTPAVDYLQKIWPFIPLLLAVFLFWLAVRIRNDVQPIVVNVINGVARQAGTDATTTTVYFSAYCNYTTSPGNAKAFGMIRARRIR